MFVLRLSISVLVSKKIFEIVNKWEGVQISIGRIQKLTSSGTFIWHSSYMMRGYGGSGKNAHATARKVRKHYQG